jgi:predicted lysophospholipase L1 biosynthesis ABC-type transport system permease subunit
VSVGILAGFLPALFFSRIKAVQVFKDASSIKVFRKLNMRKALILVQYIFSLIFITTTLIGYKQYKGFLAFDLGFSTENILNVKLKGNNSELLIKELSELTGVGKISKSSMITSVGSMHGFYAKYQNMQDSALVWFNSVDEHYLPLHGHELIAGKNFNAKARKEEESEAIVNEQMLKRFNIDIDKALGEVLTTDTDGKKLTIVGILKDFHYGTVESAIEPVMFRYNFDTSKGYINVSITTTDWPATLAKIEKAWQKIDKVHPLDAKFYDDQIADTYREYSGLVKVVGFLSFLAICISSMGLFGMVVFTTETKLKEISIRKVLGATEKNLVFLLSKGFLLLLIGSALVAIPLTYLVFDQLVLTNFVYHEPIGMVELFTGLLAVMVIAFIMIGSQTLKVARSNMAEVLKNE